MNPLEQSGRATTDGYQDISSLDIQVKDNNIASYALPSPKACIDLY